ncbi:hypothetical protein K1T71_009722 [Dendrolimus kikuchii]|uniref:Uncharacterized protein n=1 Tax=Dendrolimus kikuchii TaxID=765133 RepID=A0ACC1CSF1_9NEOP|nr:hypothetical protein K1T71_009722 [Dendrolimus kikuchii]
MVLSNKSILIRANGGACRGPFDGLKIEALNTITLQNIFSKLCKACQLNTMAAIPPAAFIAGRIREAESNMKVSKPSKGGGFGKFFDRNLTELLPLKYNSKMMNSIWGLYNRYSPHNVKKVNDANLYSGDLQHLSGASLRGLQKTGGPGVVLI